MKKHGLQGKTSNNPNGAPKKEKKEYIGIYVPVGMVEKKGGKDVIRKSFKAFLGID